MAAPPDPGKAALPGAHVPPGATRRATSSSGHATSAYPSVELADGALGAVQAADREIARQTGLRARAIAEFAASRPASADRAQGEPGAMSAERWAARPELLRQVSEWAAQELVVALSISAEAAEKLLHRSLTLVHRLPRTLNALENGDLHDGHLWPMLEKVGPIEDATVRAEVEERLLSWAAGRVTTPPQLWAKARRELLTRDARGAARRLARAIKERGVHLRPEGTEGMASVTAVLTMPEALALYRALGALADGLADDSAADPRTRGQKMADCLLDLVLRPGETDRASVQLLLTVVASMGTVLGGDAPGEVDGHVVPAEMIRDLLRACAGDPVGRPVVPSPTDPDTGRQSERPLGPQPWDGTVDEAELAHWWVEMERRVLAGELADEPEPIPDEVLLRWAGEGEGREPDPSRGSDAGPAGEAVFGSPSPDSPAEESDGGDEATASSTWWSTADRAVQDAGAALHAAADALGHARRAVRTACSADTTEEMRWRRGPGGRITAADDALGALAAATAEQRSELAALLETTGGGGLAERPRIALVNALSGTLIALTDMPELRRTGSCGSRACTRRPASCSHDLTGQPGLRPPGASAGYRPGAVLDRYVRARDRRCRFPGCRRRVPRGGELDHVRPYPLGPTSAGNLAGFCTGHHRGKHQAPGWTHRLGPDGTLTVTTTSGLTASTTPAPY